MSSKIQNETKYGSTIIIIIIIVLIGVHNPNQIENLSISLLARIVAKTYCISIFNVAEEQTHFCLLHFFYRFTFPVTENSVLEQIIILLSIFKWKVSKLARHWVRRPKVGRWVYSLHVGNCSSYRIQINSCLMSWFFCVPSVCVCRWILLLSLLTI